MNNFSDFRNNLKSGDKVIFTVQLPIGTNIQAKYLSNKIPAENWKIEKNFSSFTNLQTLSVRPDFFCHQDDICNIRKVEATTLDGKKIDFTEKVQKVKENPFAAMDLSYLIVPSNTEKIVIYYK